MTSFYIGDARRFLKTGVAAVAATALPRVAFAAPRTVKIGLVAPVTGPLAIFTEQLPWTIDQIKAFTNGGVSNKSVEPSTRSRSSCKDSQSNPNRAAEVTQELILQDKVDIVTTFATPETVNPVADQCEVNGVPCITNDAPLEPYFFGRNGDPKKGFDWTYHFFFSGHELAERAHPRCWNQLPTNKVVGGAVAERRRRHRPLERSSRHGREARLQDRRSGPFRHAGRATTTPRSRRSSRPARRSSRACCRRPSSPPSGTAARSRATSRRSFPWRRRLRVPCRHRAARRRAQKACRRGLVVGVPPVQVGPHRTELAGTRRRLREGERQASVAAARLPPRAVRGRRSMRSSARRISTIQLPSATRSRQDGLRLDRRRRSTSPRAPSEHLRDAARHRPVEEGNEISRSTRHRRQHDRAEHPGRWEAAADRPYG